MRERGPVSTSVRSVTSLPEFPWLPPVLRRLWRAPGVLQIGTDPARAVVLHNVTEDVAALIAGLDGTRRLSTVIGQSAIGESAARDVLGTLAAGGLLVDLGDAADGAPDPADHPSLGGPLAPELYGRALGALSVSPAEVLRLRARAHVVIVGGPRIAAAVGALLAASGLRRIGLVQRGTVRGADLLPGGLLPEDLGRERHHAIGEAITRSAPSTAVTALGTTDRPSIVLLAEPADPASERVRMLMATGTPLLTVSIRERRGVVGPLVIPGESSCLECQDTVRRDLDRHWGVLKPQLLSHPGTTGDGGEAALVMMTAALTTTQVLQWIDGERLPETINASLEIALPDLVLERRYWPRHTACSCRLR